MNKNNQIIPYNRQYIDHDDIKEVSRALTKKLITTGDSVGRLENLVKKKFKCKYSVSCNNGTSALFMAMRSIGLKKNDKIIIPAINFIASANVATMLEAKIILADVDPMTGQMTPKTLLDCIKKNKLKKIKAFIVMYHGGYADNVEEFFKIKKRLKCFMIEDACHAFGSKYYYKKKTFFVGSSKHSDLCTFSLHPVKTITSGEGGIVNTNSYRLYKLLIPLRSHGIDRNSKEHWIYDIKFPSMNFRLSDINCALAISQLKKLNQFLRFRKKTVIEYINYFKKYNKFFSLRKINLNLQNSYHLLFVNISFDKIGIKKNIFLNKFKKNKIILQQHYIPIYKFSFYKNKFNKLKNAESFFNNTLSFPIFYKISKQQLNKIYNTLDSILDSRNKIY
jgi:dTDP-4-amino-4,6-dideoxygalactose transaminase